MADASIPDLYSAIRQGSFVQRFWTFVEQTDTCWNWRGTPDQKGYGHITLTRDGKWTPLSAHRVAYMLLVGPLAPELTIDHLCRNRLCVNPAHLEAVSRWENVRRGNTITGNNTRKTHCAHGHALTPENLDPDKHGWRRCAECRRRAKRISEKQRRIRGVIPKRPGH